jgi:starch synthase
MLPGYGFINERRHHLHNLLRMKDIVIPIGDHMEHAFVRSSYLNCENKKVQVYFLSNKKYFDREGLYQNTDTKAYFTDNDERFIFFCRGVLETLKVLGWQPRVIHCNDWQTGLIPVLLKTVYKDDPHFKNVRTVFTAYSLASHGVFPKSSFEKLGLPSNIFKSMNGDAGKLNFLSAGMQYADVATTMGGGKTDKKLSEESVDVLDKGRKVISLAAPNGKGTDQLAEQFVEIYRDLTKT